MHPFLGFDLGEIYEIHSSPASSHILWYNALVALNSYRLQYRVDMVRLGLVAGAGVDQNSRAFLVMELMDGSLKDLLRDHAVAISWDIRVRFAADISRGMRYLHDKGTVHRGGDPIEPRRSRDPLLTFLSRRSKSRQLLLG